MYIRKDVSMMQRGEPQLGCLTDCTVEGTKEEAEQCFFDNWSVNGFSFVTYVPDDITDDDIELTASDYFTSDELEELEPFVDEYGHEAELIADFLKGLREV